MLSFLRPRISTNNRAAHTSDTLPVKSRFGNTRVKTSCAGSSSHKWWKRRGRGGGEAPGVVAFNQLCERCYPIVSHRDFRVDNQLKQPVVAVAANFGNSPGNAGMRTTAYRGAYFAKKPDMIVAIPSRREKIRAEQPTDPRHRRVGVNSVLALSLSFLCSPCNFFNTFRLNSFLRLGSRTK